MKDDKLKIVDFGNYSVVKPFGDCGFSSVVWSELNETEQKEFYENLDVLKKKYVETCKKTLVKFKGYPDELEMYSENTFEIFLSKDFLVPEYKNDSKYNVPPYVFIQLFIRDEIERLNKGDKETLKWTYNNLKEFQTIPELFLFSMVLDPKSNREYLCCPSKFDR